MQQQQQQQHSAVVSMTFFSRLLGLKKKEKLDPDKPRAQQPKKKTDRQQHSRGSSHVRHHDPADFTHAAAAAFLACLQPMPRCRKRCCCAASPSQLKAAQHGSSAGIALSPAVDSFTDAGAVSLPAVSPTEYLYRVGLKQAEMIDVQDKHNRWSAHAGAALLLSLSGASLC